jgi:hypothetical protein
LQRLDEPSPPQQRYTGSDLGTTRRSNEIFENCELSVQQFRRFFNESGIIQMPHVPKFALREFAQADVRCGSILLKKVFRGVGRIFSEAPVRCHENNVGGHVIGPISNQQPS